MWNMTRFVIYSQLNVLLPESERTMIFSCFINEEKRVSDLYKIAQPAILHAENWHKSLRSLILVFSWCYFNSSLYRRFKHLWLETVCPKASWSYTGLDSSEREVAPSSSVCVTSQISFFLWPYTPHPVPHKSGIERVEKL